MDKMTLLKTDITYDYQYAGKPGLSLNGQAPAVPLVTIKTIQVPGQVQTHQVTIKVDPQTEWKINSDNYHIMKDILETVFYKKSE
jgi:hypothetical protein